MATCNDIVSLGLKQAAIIGVSDTPTADEASAGLDVLQSLYDSWFESGEFGNLEDIYSNANVTAEEQQRITAPSGVTVTLPTTIQGGNGTRAPYLLSAVQTVINGVATNSIHEHSGWAALTGLSLSDTAPLAGFGKAGLAACHAVHWTGLFGGSVAPGTKLLADRFVSAFRAARNRAHYPSQPPAVVAYY